MLPAFSPQGFFNAAPGTVGKEWDVGDEGSRGRDGDGDEEPQAQPQITTTQIIKTHNSPKHPASRALRTQALLHLCPVYHRPG